MRSAAPIPPNQLAESEHTTTTTTVTINTNSGRMLQHPLCSRVTLPSTTCLKTGFERKTPADSSDQKQDNLTKTVARSDKDRTSPGFLRALPLPALPILALRSMQNTWASVGAKSAAIARLSFTSLCECSGSSRKKEWRS